MAFIPSRAFWLVPAQCTVEFHGHVDFGVVVVFWIQFDGWFTGELPVSNADPDQRWLALNGLFILIEYWPDALVDAGA